MTELSQISSFLLIIWFITEKNKPSFHLSSCYSVLLLTCSTHWLGFLKRHNTLVFSS